MAVVHTPREALLAKAMAFHCAYCFANSWGFVLRTPCMLVNLPLITFPAQVVARSERVIL